MKNKTDLKVPKKYASRIDEIERENCDDSEPCDAYVINLSSGWCRGDDFGVHTIIEYSKRDACSALSDAVKCDCLDCLIESDNSEAT